MPVEGAMKALTVNQTLSDKMTYKLEATTKLMVTDRRTVNIKPQQIGDIREGQTAIFTLNTGNYIDPHTVYLKGRFRATKNDGTALGATILPRLYGSIARTIDSVKISAYDGNVIEEINQFGLIADIVKNCCLSREYLCSNGQSEFLDCRRIDDNADVAANAAAGQHYIARFPAATGAAAVIGDAATQLTLVNRIFTAIRGLVSGGAVAQIATANAGEIGIGVVDGYADKFYPPKYETKEATDWIKDGRDFALPLFDLIGIFRQLKYIPMKYLGRITIEFKFVSKAVDCLMCQADPGADISLRFSNLEMVMDTVRYRDDLDMAIAKRINEDPRGLAMPFTTYFNANVTDAGQSNVQMYIAKSVSDAHSVYTVMREAASLSTWDADGYECEPFASVAGACPEFYYELGTDRFPVDKINTFTQARAELDKSFGHFGNPNRANLTLNEYQSTYFVMGVDLEADPGSNYTGRSTNSGNQIRFSISGLDATARRFDTFLYYTRVLRIKSNMNVTIEE